MADTRPQTVCESRMVDGEPMRFVGLSEIFTFDRANEIPALWDRFGPRIDQIRCRFGQIAYGINYKALTPESAFGYLAAVAVAPDAEIPADLEEFSVPALRYAVFAHDGHVSRLSETILAIDTEWLPASGYQAADTGDAGLYFFERYDADFNPRTGYGGVEIWVPVSG